MKQKRFKKLMMATGVSRNEVNALINSLKRQIQINQQSPYQEIRKLMRMLSDYDIPYTVNEYLDGVQVIYPETETLQDAVCSVIEHFGSYGSESDLLEIMGLLTEEELENDTVKGWMTAKKVFKRIQQHFKENRHE